MPSLPRKALTVSASASKIPWHGLLEDLCRAKKRLRIAYCSGADIIAFWHQRITSKNPQPRVLHRAHIRLESLRGRKRS